MKLYVGQYFKLLFLMSNRQSHYFIKDKKT